MSVITMILYWHSSQVFSLDNCVDDPPTETGLSAQSLWLHRNYCIFDGATPSLNTTVSAFGDEARQWAWLWQGLEEYLISSPLPLLHLNRWSSVIGHILILIENHLVVFKGVLQIL